MARSFNIRDHSEEIFGAERYREVTLARQSLQAADKLFAKALIENQQSKKG